MKPQTTCRPRSHRTRKRQEALHPKAPQRPHSKDLEVLPNACEIPNNVQTPEGDAANTSLDYTLSEEGEGDNINDNKELRKNGEDEHDNSSKRAKVPLPTEPIE